MYTLKRSKQDILKIILRRIDKIPWAGDECCIVLCPSVVMIVVGIAVMVDTDAFGETGEDGCELPVISEVLFGLVELGKLPLWEDEG